MLRNYRSIGKANNLIAMGGGQSQVIPETVIVKIFPINFMKPLYVELKTAIRLGGF